MIRKSKLLILGLCMSVLLTVLPGMESLAAETEGETQYAETGLQDENSQRLEEVTAMDEEGNIYAVDETSGEVADEDSGIALFSARAVGDKVVNLNTKGNAVTYYDSSSTGTGYTNGAYGADAAYLGTTEGGQIRFMISGVIGTVDASEVELVNFDSVADNVSYYSVSGGKLYHHLSYNLNQSHVAAVNNGSAPSYLGEGVRYYSYDGHYFYTDYSVMLSDYQNGVNGQSAVNAGNPFYNYFQYKNMGEISVYSEAELSSILETAMANAWIDSSSSKLTGSIPYFVKYQNEFGVNAMLSLGVAICESGWGRSSICWEKNNLFGLNAVDSSPGESANYYLSVENCIRDFMKSYMAGGYMDPTDWRYNGGYLGNKAEGINVRYASDPYWGEKIAAMAWNLDEIGGGREYAGTPAEPETPDAPSVDETPAGPETPDTPSAGETPAEPETPDTPSAGETPAEPETPDTPSAGETPAEPGIPDTPSAGETPAEPETPDTPSAGETPAEPGTPDTPPANETPAEPGTPDAPSVDETPAGPETPDAPSADGTPAEPGTPETWETPSVEADKKEVSALDNRIQVKGQLSEGASLDVKTFEPNTEEYLKYVSADEVKGKKVLGAYDIKLTGMEGESAELTFYVGTEYNGQNVIILHYTDDGSYEVYEGTVGDGQVTISVKGFSPYVIALDEGTGSSATTGSAAATKAKAVKTGDEGNLALWMILLAGSALLGIGVIGKRKLFY